MTRPDDAGSVITGPENSPGDLWISRAAAATVAALAGIAGATLEQNCQAAATTQRHERNVESGGEIPARVGRANHHRRVTQRGRRSVTRADSLVRDADASVRHTALGNARSALEGGAAGDARTASLRTG
jgi:hypothetical protein